MRSPFTPTVSSWISPVRTFTTRAFLNTRSAGLLPRAASTKSERESGIRVTFGGYQARGAAVNVTPMKLRAAALVCLVIIISRSMPVAAQQGGFSYEALAGFPYEG